MEAVTEAVMAAWTITRSSIWGEGGGGGLLVFELGLFLGGILIYKDQEREDGKSSELNQEIWQILNSIKR